MFKRLLISVLIGLIVLSGCSTENNQAENQSEKKETIESSNQDDKSSFPVTVEVDGEKVTIEEKPEKMIPLSLDVAEIVLELTDPSRVVAITKGIDDPYLSTKSEEAKDIPNRIGSAVHIDPEEILSYDTDLLLLTKMHGQEEEADHILSQVDVPMISFTTIGTVDELFNHYMIIGKAIGEQKKAEEIVGKMKSEIESIQEHIPDTVDAPSVLVLSEVGPGTGPFMMGPGNISYDLIRLAKATPAVDAIGLKHSAKASIEQILKMDPDYIFLLDFTGKGEKAHRELIESPGWNQLQAVKKNRLKILEAKYLMNPNRENIEGLSIMAKWIYDIEG